MGAATSYIFIGWIKKLPLPLLWIFQQCVQHFGWLFNTVNKICTISPSVVKIYVKLKKNISFSNDTPLQHTRHASRRTGCQQTVPSLRKHEWPPKLSRFEFWTCWAIISGPPCMLAGKVHTTNTGRSLRQFMSWKSTCRPSCEELPSQEHVNKVVANFTEHLTACVAASGCHLEHLQ